MPGRPPLRAAATLAALVFALQFAALDVVVRGGAAGEVAHAWTVRLASALLWGGVLLAARTRAARLVAATLAGALLVTQALVFRYYHAPLDVQVVATAVHAFRDVRPLLVRALPSLVASVVAAVALEAALLAVASRGELPVPSRRGRAALAAGLAGALLLLVSGRPRDATPDVAALHALGTMPLLAGAAPKAAGAVVLPPLVSTRDELPDVLLVLSESVRAEDYVPRGDGATAPGSPALTPGRVDLAELRAVSSYTAVSLSALLTGRSQEGARDEILRAPNLFDVASATRSARGERYRVLYVAAQSETVFEAKDVRASVDGFVTVETLLGRDVDDSEYESVPLDALVTTRLEGMLAESEAPVFTVLHFVGTHAPYFVDESAAPFAPWSHVVTWSGMPQLRNAYRNAIVAQDRALVRALRALEAHAAKRNRPRVVLFTSDHGEAFGEHGAIHHGQNLYDEQIHVPGWIWASPGGLTTAQSEALGAATSRFATHLDLFPTLLDVLGLGRSSALREVRAKLLGASLVAPPPERPSLVPVTNCTGMFPCPLDTWGLLDRDRKLAAQRWDGGWGCFAVDGPERFAPEGDARCEALRQASRAIYPTLPNGRPNR